MCLPFQIEGVDVKGYLTRLGSSCDEILGRHDYPQSVSVLLGELLSIAVMIGCSLKFEGKLSLQIKSDGPLSMLVADFFTPGTIRGYAHFDENLLEIDIQSKTDTGVEHLLGQGHMALVIDQGPETERYQGFVPLEGNNISELAQTYFRQSEQLPTSIKSVVAESFERVEQSVPHHSWRTGGIMLQHVPKPGAGKKEREDPVEQWAHAKILLDTVEDHELLDSTLTAESLLYRLYHEDGVRVFEHREIRAGCNCSRARVSTMLKGFPPTDLEGMAEEGLISVRCEFCGEQYKFTPEDVPASIN